MFEIGTRTIGCDDILRVVIVGTGNRLSDKSGSTRMLSHFANTVARVEWAVDYEAWQRHALSIGIDPLLVSLPKAIGVDKLWVDRVPEDDVQYCTMRSYTDWARKATTLAVRKAGEHTTFNDPKIQYIGAMIKGSLPQTWRSTSPPCTMCRPPTHPNRPAECVVSDAMHFQTMAANIAIAAAVDAASCDAAFTYLMRLYPEVKISNGCLLADRAYHADGGTGTAAQEFNVKYSDLLPLAYKGLR